MRKYSEYPEDVKVALKMSLLNMGLEYGSSVFQKLEMIADIICPIGS